MGQAGNEPGMSRGAGVLVATQPERPAVRNWQSEIGDLETSRAGTAVLRREATSDAPSKQGRRRTSASNSAGKPEDLRLKRTPLKQAVGYACTTGLCETGHGRWEKADATLPAYPIDWQVRFDKMLWSS